MTSQRRTRVASASTAAIVLCWSALASAQVPPPGPDPQPAPPPAQPAYDPSMQAGGLAPPPPMQPTTPPPSTNTGNTEQQLDRAKKEDAGRGLNWVWLNLE